MNLIDEPQLLDNLPDGAVIIDANTETILAVNDTFCKLLDYERAAIVGKSVEAVAAGVQPQNSITAQINDRHLQSNDRDSVRFIWRTETAEGTDLPLETHLGTVDNAKDKMLATVRSMNKTTNKMDKFTATDERFRRILDYLSDYILIVDKLGVIRYSSPGVKEALGHDPDGLIGTDAFKYVHPKDEQKTKAAFNEMLDNPTIEKSIEYRGLTANGTHRWIEARGSNYLDDPIINGVLVTIRDITDRKSYERRIETQNQMLERLASIVSHDLKTPVSTASKLVNLLQAELENPDSDIEKSLEKLEGVLDDLHAFTDHLPTLAHQSTHIEDPIECELVDVAQSAWRVIDTEALTLCFDGNCILDGDPRRLRQVFQNLFENVTTHAPNATTVTVGTSSDGFYIEDDGPGIESSVAENVFEYGTTSGDGTGVGLAIVQTIVEAHGWSVSVTESDAGGARFIVCTDPK